MTVGNQARIQLGMAKAQAKFGSTLDSLYGSMLANKYGNINSSYGKYSSSTDTLNDLLKSNMLKNKSDEFRSQFSDLYKSIFGIKDNDSSSESSFSTAQSIKTASANAGGAAESIKDFANSLKYSGELDVDAYRKQAQSFVDNYNAMVDKLADSDNQNVLQKGVLTVNSTKVYSNALRRAGITVGSDNKLTLMDDLSNIKASDVKSTFGSGGYSDKIIQKARQINTLTGGSGLFSKNVSGSTGTTGTSGTTSSGAADNSGTLKNMTEAVKDAATALKSYAHSLGSDDVEFVTSDFTNTAQEFIDKYNSFIDEMAKSDKSAVQDKNSALQSTMRSYSFALQRAGISVGKDGKLTLGDISKVTAEDVKYAFDNSLLDKVGQKADQVNSLVGSASAMGYSANSTASYAYNVGALFSVYA